MSNRSVIIRFSRRPLGRSAARALGLGALITSVACAGGTPTSPSTTSVADTPAQAASSGAAAVTASAKPQSGTAGTVFVEVSPGVVGFAAGVDNGVTGRFVTLAGDIAGTNFEPGTCNPGVDMSLGFPTSCVTFGDGPGQFQRAHPGNTGFTTCYCTVNGVGNAGDKVTLKISYPPATPPQYPFGFTKFTFQAGTGALAGLRGQGTLDFASDPAVSFQYHWVAAH